MATTGELLVQMSTLSTGTTLEHFTNISFGGGGGIGADDATDYLEQKFVELMFMNLDLALIGDQDGLKGSDITGNVYVVLFTADPGEVGSFVNEASYDGYTRLPIVRGAVGWEFKDGAAKNLPVTTWQPNNDSVVTITHFGIADSLIGGNLLFKKELDLPIDINTGDQAQFNVNQLAVKMN